MAQYQLSEDATQILEDLGNGSVRFIPVDEDNWHYQQYLAWVDAGNTADPATPPPPPDPNQVADRDALRTFPTRAQIQNALGQIGTDLTTLGGSPTNAQVVQVLRRTLQNQQNIIQALAALVYQAPQ